MLSEGDRQEIFVEIMAKNILEPKKRCKSSAKTLFTQDKC
jgi:hypothetical protein